MKKNRSKHKAMLCHYGFELFFDAIYSQLTKKTMHRPLSLFKSREQFFDSSDCSITPKPRNKDDSLVFSITSEKQESARDHMPLTDQNENPDKQLETIHLKIFNLNKHFLNLEVNDPNTTQSKLKRGKKQNNKSELCAYQSDFAFGKENQWGKSKAGQIVSRLDKTQRFSKRNQRNISCVLQNNSMLTDCSEIIQKNKEVEKLKHQLQSVRRSAQRSARSISQCSEKIETHKSIIKKMKKTTNQQQILIQQLKAELKKSQNIRAKQKEIILKQQCELTGLRQLKQLKKMK